MENGNLIRTDKNGTQYFEGWRKCLKCGGKGIIPYFFYNDNGVCFDCGGDGNVFEHWVVRTHEYEAKLAAKRAAKWEKHLEDERANAAAINAEFMQKIGFNENGICWVVLGDTFEIKDELKEAGARFISGIGWVFAHDIEEYKTFTVGINEVVNFSVTGRMEMKLYADIAELVSARRAENTEKHESNWQFTAGEKIIVELRLMAVFEYKNTFGDQSIYKFEDRAHNIFVWHTARGLMQDRGEWANIAATVKEHSEYNGEKQTAIIRCKVVNDLKVAGGAK